MNEDDPLVEAIERIEARQAKRPLPTDAIVAAMEPVAYLPYRTIDEMAGISIAISLKRIADALASLASAEAAISNMGVSTYGGAA